MSGDIAERLDTEISLLEAMYPELLLWDPKARELKYSSNGNSFRLRLPDSYPIEAHPQVVSATVQREDVQEQLKKRVNALAEGEEILDSVILAFEELVDSHKGEHEHHDSSNTAHVVSNDDEDKLTAVIWLHHLLSTNKRKQALSPASPRVSGVTKPGYPGVLVYSGPKDAVREHVDGLRQLNWQAFQVRLESEEEWIFSHGASVKEVEAMKDVVAALQSERRDTFLEAMRMK